ncbi:HlyD family efflux transporter periplasmic adaptor subunit [Taklimakanibacter deserti]|uniref:HlyD family efflux transporter periplasmic adaptor subunit n=1 Tax=Taklimakanibacter deserti TaxID=2267839 RepID=UPI0013C4571E
MKRLMESPRLVVGLGLAALLAYIIWIGGPYLRSIIVRDAAVTTWINIVRAPIDGYLDANPLRPGDRVGSDGRIVGLDNPLADSTRLAEALAQRDAAIARLEGHKDLVTRLERVVEDRRRLASDYAATFRRQLEAKIDGSRKIIAFLSNRLELERAQAERMAKLAKTGATSQSAFETAMGLVIEHQRLLTETETLFAQEAVQLDAAARGVFLLDDGTDGATAQRSLETALLELERAKADLAVAEAEAAAAQAVADATKDIYSKQRTAVVSAPPDSRVWSLIEAPGGDVRAGTPVASWIDCGILLVDVPVSDIEVALLNVGAEADVVLEGESTTHHGTVLLLRGSAATLGADDLAAIAKGRHPGIGQAIVRLPPDPAEIGACAIGHAAHVDFPDIGLIQVVLARLRL